MLAVKGFTHMDQATAAGPVDLARSLGNTVAVLKSKARGKSVAVSVQVEQDLIADNGPGIPAEIRDRIFDPFFTTKPAGLGTGLGLDIVRRLVLHNDGAIEVASQPGRTEFRVTLPIDEAEGSEGTA